MIFGWRDALLLLGALAFVAAIGVSRLQLAHARAALAEAKAETTRLRADLEAQSIAVDRWRAEAAARQRRAKTAVREADAYRRKADVSAARLATYSPAGKEECDAMRDLVDLARDRK